MNETDSIRILAQRLIDDPAFLSKAELLSLRELLLDFSEGNLDSEAEREVEELIKNSEEAAAIHEELTELQKFLESSEGQEVVTQSHETVRSRLSSIIRGSGKETTPLADSAQSEIDTSSQSGCAHQSPIVSQLKALAVSLADYRKNYLQLQPGLAGDSLSTKDYSNPEGFSLETPVGEMRFFVNIREHEGRSNVSFALKLPEGVHSAAIAWERTRSDSDTLLERLILGFTTEEFRIELPSIEAPNNSEEWTFRWDGEEETR